MYEKIARHLDHNIEVASYGDPILNVAVECMDCHEVIVDADYENIDECDCDEQMRRYNESMDKRQLLHGAYTCQAVE